MKKFSLSIFVFILITLYSFPAKAQEIPTEYSPELVRLAEQGNSEAQCNLGACYFIGNGVEQDYKEAVKWFKKAADQGNDWAQCNLGMFYRYGMGVQQNDEEAVKWYTKAAEQGIEFAQYELGICYLYGIGIEKNVAKALTLIEKACDNDINSAVVLAGLLYYDGKYENITVEKDYNKAFKYLKKAFDYEYCPPEIRGEVARKISACYRFGRGTKVDEEMADYYFKMAADYGEADVQNFLNEWLFKSR